LDPKVDYARIKALDDAHVLPVYRRQNGLFVRGEGVFLFDDTGKRYLDFLAGIAVNALGHCDPAMVKTLTEQAQTLIHVSNGLLTAPQAELAQKLTAITGMERVFFANCGATAMETALKIAKKYGNDTGKTDILTLNRSFHGRTLGALSATAQAKYQDPFRPLIPNFHHLPANNCEALEAAINDQTLAVMFEPIQGEGGLTVLSDAYIQLARKLTAERGALLIADEVQTGIGRTGTWLAMHQTGVMPDLLVLAKAMGGGVPIGACLTRGAMNSVLEATQHGTTYGGNPLMCAVSKTVIEEIERRDLMTNAREVGTYLAEQLATLPHVIEVRGKGMMRGAVLDEPIARDVVRNALANGLVTNATDEHTLRFVPPLIISREHVDDAMAVLRTILG
jgi:acetylornithine/N-succinyldiaminopimelate aminotransferase